MGIVRVALIAGITMGPIIGTIPPTALAQGHTHGSGGHAQGHHGGQIQKIGSYEAELVRRGPELLLYLTDEADRPISPSGFTASAVVLARGNEQRAVELTPGPENRLAGRLDFPIDGRLRATVTLRQGTAEVGRARYTLEPAAR